MFSGDFRRSVIPVVGSTISNVCGERWTVSGKAKAFSVVSTAVLLFTHPTNRADDDNLASASINVHPKMEHPSSEARPYNRLASDAGKLYLKIDYASPVRLIYSNGPLNAFILG